MKLAGLSILILMSLLWSSDTVHQLSRAGSKHLFHEFQFTMTGKVPGAAVAFRLARGAEHVQAKLCFRRQCFQGTEQWQLFATDPEVASKQILVLMNARDSWGFRTIGVNAGIFEMVHARIANLRLPTSVLENLKERAGEIEEDIAADQKLFTENSDHVWSKTWILPVEGDVTSPFGSMREAPGVEPYFHTGVDLRAAKGTPVHACSDGIVVDTGDEVISGRVVTIDHGHGVMSRYMHLSSFKVHKGDAVKAGDVIGLSGATGRVEGPHLHWELRIHGRPADPLSTRRLLASLSYPE